MTIMIIKNSYHSFKNRGNRKMLEKIENSPDSPELKSGPRWSWWISGSFQADLWSNREPNAEPYSKECMLRPCSDFKPKSFNPSRLNLDGPSLVTNPMKSEFCKTD